MSIAIETIDLVGPRGLGDKTTETSDSGAYFRILDGFAYSQDLVYLLTGFKGITYDGFTDKLSPVDSRVEEPEDLYPDLRDFWVPFVTSAGVPNYYVSLSGMEFMRAMLDWEMAKDKYSDLDDPSDHDMIWRVFSLVRELRVNHHDVRLIIALTW